MFRVVGERPERWVRQTDFSNDEAVGYLADRLARLGVEDRAVQGRRGRRRRRSSSAATTTPSSSTGSPRCPPAPSSCTGPRGSDVRLEEPAPARPARRSARTTPSAGRPGPPRARTSRPSAAPGTGPSPPSPTSRPVTVPTRLRWRPARADPAPRPPARTGRGRPVDAVDGAVGPCLRLPACPPATATPSRKRAGSSSRWARSSLTTAEGELDLDRLHRVVDVLAAQRGSRHRRWCWSPPGPSRPASAPLGLPRRPRDLATQQAAASVGQGPLLAAYSKAFGGHGLTVGQVLLTADDVIRRTHYANARRTLDRLLDLGVVPVVNENDTVATHEIRFGDNDRLAALVAHLVHADALRAALRRRRAVRRAAGAGGHDADPAGARSRRPRRRAHRRLRLRRRHRRHGHQGRGRRHRDGRRHHDRADLGRRSSARCWPATTSAPGLRAHRLAARPPAALAGARDHPARAGCCSTTGAVAAVVDRRKSLLPAGIVCGRGQLRRRRPGRPVRPGRAGRRPAGWSTTTRSSCPGCSGGPPTTSPASSARAYEREVVHRDDLVLL